MKSWKKKTNATFGIDEKGLVLVVLLQILGGDGSCLWLLLGSLIRVSSVHFRLICSVRYTSFSYISRTPQRMRDRNDLPVLTCPSRCTSPRSSQFWVAKHDFLVSNKTIVNSFVVFFLSINSFAASLPRVEGDKVLFLFFSFAVSSTMGSLLLDYVVLDWESVQSPLTEIFDWISFQPRYPQVQ